ncbi:T9SS type A sorting domain-containing protein [Pontibacter sp. G13]|uniref:T9SS type A sorting domain-containing protein n=1 Tax=Pontibacter sp. G13 TaxID=3074898 RepID=UPI00288B0DC9|nr:T9SS type A sorting domain-containing protein [Pontibacter sp. G13]WNJ18004.1 T9SS type A sorting domain-containing protein [Pontibacter sp. G13]
MKYLLLVACLISSFPLYAQQEWSWLSRPEEWTHSSLFEWSQRVNDQILNKTDPWTNKVEFVYSTKLDSAVERLEETGEKLRKFFYGYDADGYQVEEFTYHWDASEGDWIPYEWAVNERNLDGSIREMAIYRWGGEWVGVFRFKHSYGSDGELLEYLSYDWNVVDQEWTPYWKRTYQYRRKGTRIHILEYIWDNTQTDWVGQFRYYEEYNSDGVRLDMIQEIWNPSSQSWDYQLREQVLVDPDGYWQDEIRSRFEGASGWEPFSKVKLRFDEANRQVAEFHYDWVVSSQLWRPLTRTQKEWGIHGIDLEVSEVWSQSQAEWQKSEEKQYRYDPDGRLNRILSNVFDTNSRELLIQYSQNRKVEALGNLLKKNLLYRNSHGDPWAVNFQYDYQYSYEESGGYVLGISASPNLRISHRFQTHTDRVRLVDYFYSEFEGAYEADLEPYPNPSSGQVFWEVGVRVQADVFLYDLQGRLVGQAEVLRGKPVDFQEVPGGIYIWVLIGDGIFDRGKIQMN